MVLKFLQKLPIPISGLALGLVALGNLMKQEHWLVWGNFTGCLGIILLSLVLAKIIFAAKTVVTALKDPVVASVAPTFSMAWMVTATYLLQWGLPLNFLKFFWLIGFVLHWGLLCYFTWAFVIKVKLSLNQVYPSWYIVYIGLGIIPITGNAFYPQLTHLLFYPILIAYLGMLPFVLYRAFFGSPLKKPQLPLNTIIAAPTSLCLTGYLKTFSGVNEVLMVSLLSLAQILYLGTLIFLVVRALRVPFYPSYSAFTFPLVISATALTCVNDFWHLHYPQMLFFDYIEGIEVVLAGLMVFYVLFRYLHFFKTSLFVPLETEK